MNIENYAHNPPAQPSAKQPIGKRGQGIAADDRLDLKRGHSAVVRLLPMQVGGETKVWVRVGRHWVNKRPHNCRRISNPLIGGDPGMACPICKMVAEMASSTDKEVQTAAEWAKAKPYWLVFVIPMELFDRAGHPAKGEIGCPRHLWLPRTAFLQFSSICKTIYENDRVNITAGETRVDLLLAKDDHGRLSVELRAAVPYERGKDRCPCDVPGQSYAVKAPEITFDNITSQEKIAALLPFMVGASVLQEEEDGEEGASPLAAKGPVAPRAAKQDPRTDAAGDWAGSLDRSKLERARIAGDKIIARCPACAAQGHDKTGDHLVIFANGSFGCVKFQGDDGAEHRKLIFRLAGRSRSRRTLRKKGKLMVDAVSGPPLTQGQLSPLRTLRTLNSKPLR